MGSFIFCPDPQSRFSGGCFQRGAYFRSIDADIPYPIISLNDDGITVGDLNNCRRRWW